jgi:hypothetical protein
MRRYPAALFSGAGEMTAKIPEEALNRLAEYWGRAQIMRRHFQDYINSHGGIPRAVAEGNGLRLQTYLSFWMAALFVAVEGFNKLKLKDAHVQKLFREHLNDLKQLRHETYHFNVSREKGGKAIKAINWAEELHVALGLFIEQHVDIRGIDR